MTVQPATEPEPEGRARSASAAAVSTVVCLTTGEPAGIGPELAVRAAERFARQRQRSQRLVLVGNADWLAQEAGRLAIADLRQLPGVDVLDTPLANPVVPGRLDPANALHVVQTLQHAADRALAGQAQAIVTAPVHKGVINDAGVPFTGHTEFFQEHAGRDRVVMMLAGGGLRVALATTHLALRDVPAALTAARLDQVLRILHAALQSDFGLPQPRIAVCGLNPHAGEGGHLGREEIDVIQPVLERLRAEGMALDGPLPADTLFVPARVAPYAAVLAMYHDQGLPVLKHASFGHGVNITLGLPYVRTSVDHGTALDLAGQGVADPQSLYEAVDLAFSLAARRSVDAASGLVLAARDPAA